MFIINYTNKDNKNSHPTYDDNETKCLINHYKMLLKSEDLPLEEVNAYEDAINNLEENLILRRKK